MENQPGNSEGPDKPPQGGGEAPPDIQPPPAVDPGFTGYEREGSGQSAGQAPPPSGGYGGPQPPTGYTHYPRYSFSGYGKVPPGPAVVRFAAIGEAWELIRQDLGTYVGATLIMGGIGYLLSWIAQMVTQLYFSSYIVVTPMMTPEEIFFNPALWMISSVSTIVFELVLYILGAGYFSMCLRRLRGEPFSVGNLFDGFKFFGRLLAAAIVTTLIRNIAIFLLVIPGIFAAGALAFVPLIILDQRAGAFESILLSYQAAKKDMFMMGLLCLVVAVIAWIGCCGACVLLLFSTPIYFMVIAMHYHAYFPPQQWPQEISPLQVAPQYSV
jgi:hypothetical protein